jgi:hypothetical protein
MPAMPATTSRSTITILALDERVPWPGWHSTVLLHTEDARVGKVLLLRGLALLGRYTISVMRAVGMLSVMVVALAANSLASATLLLEEPYGKLGFFTATGHSAVYLSGVCAETPVILRRCVSGEMGVVLSRYDGVGSYDWIAIPLIPYLYAVDQPEDLPLFADAKMVAFLRDRYRRTHLEDVAPDLPNGESPGGNWYELVGSSYDRTTYGFEIETTSAQDDALILKFNSSPNRSHFHILTRNCADFVKDVMNFYQPKAVHRSYVADVGITTPKQMAKNLVKFSIRHPELGLSRVILPQVPGSIARSKAVHGVVESFFKSKKYIVPSAVVSPIFAGCVAAVFVGSGSGRFDPGRNAMVFVPDSEPDLPLSREDLQAYRKALDNLLAMPDFETTAGNAPEAWELIRSEARPGLDQNGRPVLQLDTGPDTVSVGASADNVLTSGSPTYLVRALLKARVQAELRRSNPLSVSGREFARDWKLLQVAMKENGPQVTAQLVRDLLEPSASLRTRASAFGDSATTHQQ